METPNLPAIRALRPAWNKGRIVGQKRPLKPKHVWAIRVRLELAENHRDLALFNMAIDSKLRGCDLVKMKVVDVMASGQIKERVSVLQSKTQKPVRFEISEGIRRDGQAERANGIPNGARGGGWIAEFDKWAAEQDFSTDAAGDNHQVKQSGEAEGCGGIV